MALTDAEKQAAMQATWYGSEYYGVVDKRGRRKL
jgi:hypothetical protein